MCAVPSCTTCASAAAVRPASRKSCRARRRPPRSKLYFTAAGTVLAHAKSRRHGGFLHFCPNQSFIHKKHNLSVPNSPASASPVEPINAVSLRAFEPRSVPVIAVDSDLPAVAPQHLTAPALRARFANPPKWTPEVRREPKLDGRVPAQAAVLIPIV